MSSVKTDPLFENFKERLLSIDPVYWCEHYLTLDGSPFRLNGNGYKPFSDIYRYIAIKALEPDSLPVVLVKGRQTGGSTMAAALELYFVGCGLFGVNEKPPVRIIHAFPWSDSAQNYTKEKLNIMIRTAKSIGETTNKGNNKSYIETLLADNQDSNNSLKFKGFKNGNYIRIDSTGLDGGRLRGGTADIIFFDESQDISGEAIGNTVEMLKQAKYGRIPGGIQVYFGTPKRKGSDFHKIWLASSQQYYYLGCEKCKKHFPLYTPESNDWEKIWIRGFIVKCTHCGHEQDKRLAAERGKWVGTKDINDPSVRFIGFHVNQFYMPNISREAIENEKPGIHPTKTERQFKNENLGEFYQGDATPITSEEIRTMCGERERGMRARILPGEEQFVILGIDYGKRSDLDALVDPNKNKKGQSYTTAVLLTVKGPNLFSIDFALKFPKNTPEAKKGLIDNIMRQYSVNLAIGDIGYSDDFSYILNQEYGDKYLVSRVQGKLSDKIKFIPEATPKEIQFEKDFYITEMLDLLRKGQIKFPLKDYDKVAWLIEHCASMELKPSISRTGEAEIHYVKGSIGNDGLMALINAYIGYKFLITNGFKIKNPLLYKDPKSDKNKRPLAVLGYLPK